MSLCLTCSPSLFSFAPSFAFTSELRQETDEQLSSQRLLSISVVTRRTWQKLRSFWSMEGIFLRPQTSTLFVMCGFATGLSSDAPGSSEKDNAVEQRDGTWG